MSQEHALIGGPTKFDLMVAHYDSGTVIFRSQGAEFIVQPMTVSPLDDKGHDAYNIRGYIRDTDGTFRTRRECHIIFSSRDRKGLLTDHGPKKEKKTLGNLDRMTSEQLRVEVASNQRFATAMKEQLDEYLAGLDLHNKLALEAWIASKIGEACMHAQLDHEFLIKMRQPSLREASTGVPARV